MNMGTGISANHKRYDSGSGALASKKATLRGIGDDRQILDRPDERGKDIGTPPVRQLPHFRHGLAWRDRLLIAPGRCHGIEDVGDAYDLGMQRDLVAREPVGIPGAVQLLVMPPD